MRETEGKVKKKTLGAPVRIQEAVCEGLCLDELSLPPCFSKLSLHPADVWLICSGGLLVAKTGYGAVEIRNSRDQNCQHGFQWFIFSMLSTAWYSLTVFLFFFSLKEGPAVRQLAMEAKYCAYTDYFGGINKFSVTVHRELLSHYRIRKQLLCNFCAALMALMWKIEVTSHLVGYGLLDLF